VIVEKGSDCRRMIVNSKKPNRRQSLAFQFLAVEK
jgi:hypothetical protein